MKADVMRAMRQRKASPLSEAPVKMQGHAERSEAPVKDKVMLSGKVLRGKVLSGKVMLNGKGLSGKGHAERQGHAERSEASMHSAGIIDNSLIMTILPLSPLFARSG